jgi:hypothetical protein
VSLGCSNEEILSDTNFAWRPNAREESCSEWGPGGDWKQREAPTINRVGEEPVGASARAHKVGIIDSDGGGQTVAVEERLRASSAWADVDLVFCNEIGGPVNLDKFTRDTKRLAVEAGVQPLALPPGDPAPVDNPGVAARRKRKRWFRSG